MHSSFFTISSHSLAHCLRRFVVCSYSAACALCSSGSSRNGSGSCSLSFRANVLLLFLSIFFLFLSLQFSLCVTTLPVFDMHMHEPNDHNGLRSHHWFVRNVFAIKIEGISFVCLEMDFRKTIFELSECTVNAVHGIGSVCTRCSTQTYHQTHRSLWILIIDSSVCVQCA